MLVILIQYLTEWGIPNLVELLSNRFQILLPLFHASWLQLLSDLLPRSKPWPLPWFLQRQTLTEVIPEAIHESENSIREYSVLRTNTEFPISEIEEFEEENPWHWNGLAILTLENLSILSLSFTLMSLVAGSSLNLSLSAFHFSHFVFISSIPSVS